jgi:hypothetical protein
VWMERVAPSSGGAGGGGSIAPLPRRPGAVGLCTKNVVVSVQLFQFRIQPKIRNWIEESGIGLRNQDSGSGRNWIQESGFRNSGGRVKSENGGCLVLATKAARLLTPRSRYHRGTARTPRAVPRPEAAARRAKGGAPLFSRHQAAPPPLATRLRGRNKGHPPRISGGAPEADPRGAFQPPRRPSIEGVTPPRGVSAVPPRLVNRAPVGVPASPRVVVTFQGPH